ncbi:NAD(P)-dependent alcohol dehydrogenase [Enterobacteriaceae bacterium YMB-R22]|uniref:zinc-dependent alcohol dehydrogenase family protein n=2 Tax=Enterobacteriaceae TaxID=543 RepID=UPI00201233F6|nr:NAD(P)-dependent alcohol dehydrogenase [Tenebrionicola larvae]MBV4413899.1 NAD(P)-dependent alcohol dehydrogenase [Tenebrionicola larvae]
MKAAILGAMPGINHIQRVVISDPGKPAYGEIRVRIASNSLNFHDFNVAVGVLPAAAGRILLSDGAGVVEEVGEGVTEFAPGDNVVSLFFPDWREGEATVANFSRTPGDGIDGYAVSRVVRPAGWFTHMPKGWTHSEAATLPTAGLTAWRALVVNGKIKAGDDVLILGTGGVSIFALQFALMAGARVWATTSSDEKAQWLLKKGVAGVVNYRTEPEWGKKIFDMTGGRGVDHVIEIGGPGTLSQSIAAARIGGHISLIGVFTGVTGDVSTGDIIAKQLKIKGVAVGNRAHQCDMIKALNATNIRPVIDCIFPFEEITAAFEHQIGNRHIGKICLEL